MFTATAVVRTEHAERYLARLGGHVAKMGRHWGHRLHGHSGRHKPPEVRHMEWSATSGTVQMDWGSWTVQAAAGTLRVQAEAVDETSLRHIQALLAARLENLGRREQLTVRWQPPGPPAASPVQAE